MKTFTSTEVQQKFGDALNLVEDNILGAMVEKAMKEGSASDTEVNNLLDNIRNA